MKKNYRSLFILAAILSIAFVSCKKTNDATPFVSYRSYTNLKPGKYIVYALDSTITRSFGTSFVISSNIIKDSVAEEIIDNQNRQSFKVFRFRLDPVHNTWAPINTFYYTPTDNSLEYVENNLRYIKLVSPVTEGKSWFGNMYLNSKVFHGNSFYPEWNFYYKDVNQPKTVGNFDFANTITVVQYDSADNKPFYPYGFNTYDKGYEIYADSIGLVYRDVMSWEYQSSTAITNCVHTYPNPSGPGTVSSPINCDLPDSKCDSLRLVANHKVACDTIVTDYHYNGYGTKQTILSHN